MNKRLRRLQRHWNKLLILALSVPVATPVLAVDKSRLWLPHKYSNLMSKLVDAANQAESSHRCEWVINGELNVKKSTDEHHYFVITCRDKQRRSYIQTYLYPVDGNKASLLTEQGGGSVPEKILKADSEQVPTEQPKKMDAMAGREACDEAFWVATGSMDGVVVIESEVSVVEHDEGTFLYQFPFNIDSALGNNIRHRADCQVSTGNEAQVSVFLESEGALALCTDTLKEETLLMRHVKVNSKPLKVQRNNDGGYAFTIEFGTKSRRGSSIRYTAQCDVAANGENEVRVLLDKSGALAICKDTLRSEAIQLTGLQVIEEQIPAVQENEEGFFYHIPFKATIPSGDKGFYQADCQVDFDGTSDVSFSIDRQSVIPLCIKKLKANTRNMIEVEILDQANIPVDKHDEGYVSDVPFNSKSPMGRTLHYMANCRVNGIGAASVSIAARAK